MTSRRVILWILNALGAFVGAWALACAARLLRHLPERGLRPVGRRRRPVQRAPHPRCRCAVPGPGRCGRRRRAVTTSGCLHRRRRGLAGVLRAALRLPPRSPAWARAARRRRAAHLARGLARARDRARHPAATPRRPVRTRRRTRTGDRRMRIAVAGGTGTVGRHVVDVVREAGHEPVVLTRSTGVDLVTGVGLAEALAGVDVVIDVASTQTMSDAASRAFFGSVTRNLLAAEADGGRRAPRRPLHRGRRRRAVRLLRRERCCRSSSSRTEPCRGRSCAPRSSTSSPRSSIRG